MGSYYRFCILYVYESSVSEVYILEPFWFAYEYFSSPEPQAQVSFSDHNLSVVVVIAVVNFSHFHLLLQNHWANFNQTWHKSSLGDEDLSFLNEGSRPFPRGDNYKIA